MGDPDTITTDQAWYRWSDVMFWYQSLPEGSLERSTLAALLNRDSLASPNHPLREKGQRSLVCAIVTFADGRRALCFSLRQVQYLQYFVHRTCLAEAEYVAQLYALKVAGKDMRLPPPTPSRPPIPLPNHPILPAFVSETENVTLEGRDFKKLSEQIKKANKRMDRGERTVPIIAAPAPAADQTRGEGEVEEDPEAGPSSPRSSTSSATLLADQVLSDDEGEEEAEPQLTDPDALPRPEPVGNAELYYRAHVALESASLRSFLTYYLQGQEPNAALALLPEWVGCGVFFSLVPNFVGDALTDVGLCTLSFPLVGDDVQPTRDTRHFVVAEASQIPGFTPPEDFEPVKFEDLADRVNAAIDEAWDAGGGGARYFVKHPSESCDFSRFGVDTSSWHSEMHRAGVALAPWTDPGAWGETFELDIARLLEPIGAQVDVDLGARAPAELCGLFDVEQRDTETAAARAELLIELAAALLETPLNATYMKFLHRWAALQSSLESTQKALRKATERAVATSSASTATTAAEQPAEANGDKPKPKKKKKKGKKKRRLKTSAPPGEGEAPANGDTPEHGAREEDTTDTTTTDADEYSDSDGEPDFSGGVLLGRDGKLVSYVREV